MVKLRERTAHPRIDEATTLVDIELLPKDISFFRTESEHRMRSIIYFAVCIFGSCCFAVAQENRPNFTISNRDFGYLTLWEGKVIFTKARVGEKSWWTQPVDDSKKNEMQYVHPFNQKSFLTANEKGEVFLSEKPDPGSNWGFNFPKGEPVQSWLQSSFGRVEVVKAGRVIKDESGKEHDVYDLRVSRPASDDTTKQHPRFLIDGVN
jgi:hypothetical protein